MNDIDRLSISFDFGKYQGKYRLELVVLRAVRAFLRR